MTLTVPLKMHWNHIMLFDMYTRKSPPTRFAGEVSKIPVIQKTKSFNDYINYTVLSSLFLSLSESFVFFMAFSSSYSPLNTPK